MILKAQESINIINPAPLMKPIILIESCGDNMLTLNDLDTLDRLFESAQSYEQALEKFILYKTGQKTLEGARSFAVINPDIGWLFNKIDSQKNNQQTGTHRA
jgi:hypothetical protein